LSGHMCGLIYERIGKELRFIKPFLINAIDVKSAWSWQNVPVHIEYIHLNPSEPATL